MRNAANFRLAAAGTVAFLTGCSPLPHYDRYTVPGNTSLSYSIRSGREGDIVSTEGVHMVGLFSQFDGDEVRARGPRLREASQAAARRLCGGDFKEVFERMGNLQPNTFFGRSNPLSSDTLIEAQYRCIGGASPQTPDPATAPPSGGLR